MHVSSQDMALAYDSPLFRESLCARLHFAEKRCEKVMDAIMSL